MKGDEGRGVAAKRFGEVPSNLRSGDVRMRKLTGKRFPVSVAIRKQTQGSETSQYLEEKRLIKYFVSSGERTRISPNPRS